MTMLRVSACVLAVALAVAAAAVVVSASAVVQPSAAAADPAWLAKMHALAVAQAEEAGGATVQSEPECYLLVSYEIQDSCMGEDDSGSNFHGKVTWSTQHVESEQDLCFQVQHVDWRAPSVGGSSFFYMDAETCHGLNTSISENGLDLVFDGTGAYEGTVTFVSVVNLTSSETVWPWFYLASPYGSDDDSSECVLSCDPSQVYNHPILVDTGAPDGGSSAVADTVNYQVISQNGQYSNETQYMRVSTCSGHDLQCDRMIYGWDTNMDG